MKYNCEFGDYYKNNDIYIACDKIVVIYGMYSTSSYGIAYCANHYKSLKEKSLKSLYGWREISENEFKLMKVLG